MSNRKYIASSFFLLLLFFTSCENGDNNNQGVNALSKDNDSLTFDSSLAAIMKDYISIYSDSLFVDTSFVNKLGEIRISFKYHCLYDNTLILPEKYLSIYGLKKFVTHNFSAPVTIWHNRKLVLDTLLDKKFFYDSTIRELNSFGALIAPSYSITDSMLYINFSLSIPLTDIGQSKSVAIDYYGRVEKL